MVLPSDDWLLRSPTSEELIENSNTDSGCNANGAGDDVLAEFAQPAFLENFISSIWKNNSKKGDRAELTEKDIINVIRSARKKLACEPSLLVISTPVNVCGDIHGQFEDLLRIFKVAGSLPNSKYLFLGDYVDRGDKSVEVMALLLACKARYPAEMFLLRGNHESMTVNKGYTFYTECIEKYSKALYLEFSECFNYLPVAALIGGKIFCVHGGLSPDMEYVEVINTIKRPMEVPRSGLVRDLLWADPSECVKGFQYNLDRGTSFVFGEDVIQEFLDKNGIDLICRAHEVAMKGYKFFKRKRQLVTLFSAPKYDGYNNKGAVMVVSKNLTVSFKIIC